MSSDGGTRGHGGPIASSHANVWLDRKAKLSPSFPNTNRVHRGFAGNYQCPICRTGFIRNIDYEAHISEFQSRRPEWKSSL